MKEMCIKLESRDNSRDKELDEPKPAEKPISLHPLKFKEAVKGLFEVKPKKVEKADSGRD